MNVSEMEVVCCHYVPSAPMRHMTNSSPTQKNMSMFIRCSILLRLYRGPLLFSMALVSWPSRQKGNKRWYESICLEMLVGTKFLVLL